MTNLPHSTARCQGTDCAIKTECARFIHRADLGPRTPWLTPQQQTGYCAMFLKDKPAKPNVFAELGEMRLTK